MLCVYVLNMSPLAFARGLMFSVRGDSCPKRRKCQGREIFLQKFSREKPSACLDPSFVSDVL